MHVEGTGLVSVFPKLKRECRSDKIAGSRVRQSHVHVLKLQFTSCVNLCGSCLYSQIEFSHL